MGEALATTLGRIAASADAAPVRGLALLTALRSTVPFDAAWLASADARGGVYLSLAELDLSHDVREFLGGPAAARDVAEAGADRDGPPVCHSDDPGASATPTWVDCLTPAGFQESLTLGLFVRVGGRVGLLVLLFRSPSPPPRTVRRRLAGLAPVLALGMDPMPGLLATTRLVPGTTAGTLLHGDGSVEPLPGLPGDHLLEDGSPVLAEARGRLDDGLFHSSFLWPLGGSSAPDGHARVTVVAAPEDAPAFLAGVVLVSPSPGLHGLTPRELEVLGLMVHGCSNQEIARALVVAPRTAAAHVEHVLVKLAAGTRTTAAVRAEREGLYVPSSVAAPTGPPRAPAHST
ncbi:response regulator transcription factor [Nocardioides sp. CFH 31398]|uniref:response regulator transcription factor n=1 Tax=Nocardioides sp. CFH 31398 TaxID=2919579 RepID=UPI001F060ECD|nr:helix-turn-helix transcriptional regulator [Nocardioides sp. CFH 31398]MCH1866527.1 helix-turn-helix transcriptional regulator [Nocardioides sp. CFH 31398]